MFWICVWEMNSFWFGTSEMDSVSQSFWVEQKTEKNYRQLNVPQRIFFIAFFWKIVLIATVKWWIKYIETTEKSKTN